MQRRCRTAVVAASTLAACTGLQLSASFLQLSAPGSAGSAGGVPLSLPSQLRSHLHWPVGTLAVGLGLMVGLKRAPRAEVVRCFAAKKSPSAPKAAAPKAASPKAAAAPQAAAPQAAAPKAAAAPAAPALAPAAAPAAALDPLVALVLGGPGSGKGTQCDFIAKELGYVHLSAGQLLREAREDSQHPELRKTIEDVIVAGKTVPSSVINELLEHAMQRHGAWDGSGVQRRFVVDGYPRSQEQLQGWTGSALSRKTHLSVVLSLEVSKAEMQKRLQARAAVSGRSDDNADTVEKRFATYEAETGPLLKHFEASGLLCRLDGGASPQQVWKKVKGKVQEAEARLSGREDGGSPKDPNALRAFLLGR